MIRFVFQALVVHFIIRVALTNIDFKSEPMTSDRIDSDSSIFQAENSLATALLIIKKKNQRFGPERFLRLEVKLMSWAKISKAETTLTEIVHEPTKFGWPDRLRDRNSIS